MNLIRLIILALGLLPGVPFADSSTGSVEISVERESPLESSYYPILVIYPQGQSLFGSNSKVTVENHDKQPRFYQLSASSEKPVLRESLPVGSYQSLVILKKTMANCNISGGKATGFCLPEKDDVSCSGPSFEIMKSETHKAQSLCRAGK